MSTDLLDEDNGAGVYLTRFWGGVDKGVSYQIGDWGSCERCGYARYVQLTEAQLKAVITAFVDSMKGTAP